MPKKGGKKGGKKKKGPSIHITNEACDPFGFRFKDIVRTPLGLTATVLGVKYDDPSNKETGRLWVEYPTGRQSPLEPRLGAGFVGSLGYRRAAEADHIWRDVLRVRHAMKEDEEKRAAIEETNRLRREALALANEVNKPKKKAQAPRPNTAP